MKILLFTDHFYPNFSSGGRLLTDLALGLVERGHEVQVITCFASYNTSFKGIQNEELSGIKISRIYLNRFSRFNLIGRFFDELLFCITLLVKNLFFRQKVDVILTLSSPPFLPFFTMIISLIKNAPYVYIVMDIFPDIAVNLGLLKSEQKSAKIWQFISKMALEKSAQIIVLGRCMKKIIQTKIPNQATPINIIHNWSDSRKLKPLNRHNNPFFLEYPDLKEKLIIQYSGNLGRFHDFETILSAAKQIQTNSLVHFLIIGEGFQKQWLLEELKKRNLKNVTLLPFQAEENLIYSLNACDLALVSLKRGSEGLGVPSKFYPILAVGKPVIAIMAEWAEVALMVKDYNLGAVLEQGDTIGFIETIEKFLNHPELIEEIAQRTRSLFLDKFDRSIAITLYEKCLYKAIISEQA